MSVCLHHRLLLFVSLIVLSLSAAGCGQTDKYDVVVDVLSLDAADGRSWDIEQTDTATEDSVMAAVDGEDAAVEADAGSTQTPSAGAAHVRYPSQVVHSPITASVAKRIGQIWAKDPSLKRDVFMKVGASSTVSPKTLSCFAANQVDLGEFADLQDALDYFLAGNAAGTSPFERKTLAAISGKTAKWAMSGSPSPVQKEFDAINPSIAIVHYGTNDMGMASTYLKAMYPFYIAMRSMLQWMTQAGIVPILTGISPRQDSVKANRWVSSYNTLIRGLAQHYQVPFVDLWEATKELKDHGMAADGIHLNGYKSGACTLSPEGLGYGYNVRNQIVLEALDRLYKIQENSDKGLDPDQPSDLGQGSKSNPFEVLSFPYVDSRDTATTGVKQIDQYPGCASDADESGPELWYRFTLTEPTALRAVVVDGVGVDVDLHLLDQSASAVSGCLARDHRGISGTLAAGSYYIVVDTFVSKGQAAAGEYTLVMVRCDSGDPQCTQALN